MELRLIVIKNQIMNNTQNDFISGIGNTPLIKLRAASEITGCNIYGKAEFLNPGGSVKDRAALALIKDAQEKKLISKGGTVVEGTAGNTGIGLGLLGNSLGYKTIIVMNDNQTQEKKDLLRNLGAELRLVPPKPYKDDNNFVKVAARLADELRPSNNNGVIWANQFDNTANAKGHYEGTGQEIWEQTDGKVDGFVCSSGTGGTISGVSNALKEKNKDIKIYLSDPKGSALYNYIKNGELKMKVPLIISNHSDLENIANDFNAKFVHIDTFNTSKSDVEDQLLNLLKECEIDLVVLAKYMQILSNSFLKKFSSIINIHHSFLPAFKGAQPYHRALKRGVKLIGATAHYVTEDLDEGPIIEQCTVNVSHRDEVDDLIRKGRDIERIALARAVRLHLNHQVFVYNSKTAVFD